MNRKKAARKAGYRHPGTTSADATPGLASALACLAASSPTAAVFIAGLAAGLTAGKAYETRKTRDD